MPITDTFFALTVRGLENVIKDEVVSLFGNDATIKGTSYRKVVFTYKGPIVKLLGLHTVDDVFFHLKEFPVTHLRKSLGDIKQETRSIHIFPKVLKKLRSVRLLPQNTLFSITVNNVGEKNYSPIEVKEAIAHELTEKYNWEYSINDVQEAVNIRVFIEKSDVLLGVRLASIPLHRRSYKRHSLPGSLKASVANCLLYICGVKPTDKILDPMCGVGTIAIEALQYTPHVIAGDINPEAIRYAQQNAKDFKHHIMFNEWDARKTQLRDASIDSIVTNLPFDKQVKIEYDTDAFFPEIIAEMNRVLKPKGKAVILTIHREALIDAITSCGTFAITNEMEISLFGETPYIIKMIKNQ